MVRRGLALHWALLGKPLVVVCDQWRGWSKYTNCPGLGREKYLTEKPDGVSCLDTLVE